MTSDRGLQGALQSWLNEDRHEDATRILHTVLDGVGTTPQHRPRWSVGGILTMNKFVAIGLGTAAVVAVLLIGAQLFGSPTGGVGGSPSGASGRIVFASDRDGPMSIYVLDLASGEVSRLTSHDGVDAFADIPRWSPDGTRIAFTADWVEPDPSGCASPCTYEDVWIMDASGDHQERLSFGDTTELPESWSPDGATLLIDQFDDDGNLQVVTLDGSGSGTASALTSGDINGQADWSPDGETIVFMSLRDGDREIYLMAPDGSEQSNLTRSPEAEDYLPRWSPDGRHIVFVSERDGNREVYVMDADGRNVVRLTDSPGNDWFPEWSPDGREIVFASSRDGDEELFVMAADGTDLRQLTFNDAVDGKPDWID
jgi:Tol biopolymer transport system component